MTVEGEFRAYRSGDQSVTASWYSPEGFVHARGTADAGSLGGPEEWWINRVVVTHRGRGRGVGRALLDRLKELAVKLGATRLRVCPGGYDIPYEQQVKFYERCGFEDVGEGVYEWRPKDLSA